MNEKIYIILKSLNINKENYYDSVPSTWCTSAEDATELLTKTLKRFKEWYPDLEVLGHDANSLHIRYHDDDGQLNRAYYWVREVTKYDQVAL